MKEHNVSANSSLERDRKASGRVRLWPRSGVCMIDGFWDLRGSRRVWVDGRWGRPPRAGVVWVPDRWERTCNLLELSGAHVQ
jgi:hypothetical protein